MGDAWKALRELEGMRSEFNGSDGGTLFGAHVEHVGNQTTHREVYELLWKKRLGVL